jgi:hypothetical protein
LPDHSGANLTNTGETAVSAGDTGSTALAGAPANTNPTSITIDTATVLSMPYSL